MVFGLLQYSHVFVILYVFLDSFSSVRLDKPMLNHIYCLFMCSREIYFVIDLSNGYTSITTYVLTISSEVLILGPNYCYLCCLNFQKTGGAQ